VQTRTGILFHFQTQNQQTSEQGADPDWNSIPFPDSKSADLRVRCRPILEFDSISRLKTSRPQTKVQTWTGIIFHFQTQTQQTSEQGADPDWNSIPFPDSNSADLRARCRPGLEFYSISRLKTSRPQSKVQTRAGIIFPFQSIWKTYEQKTTMILTQEEVINKSNPKIA
jgi:hypothetical protein